MALLSKTVKPFTKATAARGKRVVVRAEHRPHEPIKFEVREGMGCSSCSMYVQYPSVVCRIGFELSGEMLAIEAVRLMLLLFIGGDSGEINGCCYSHSCKHLYDD